MVETTASERRFQLLHRRRHVGVVLPDRNGLKPVVLQLVAECRGPAGVDGDFADADLINFLKVDNAGQNFAIIRFCPICRFKRPISTNFTYRSAVLAISSVLRTVSSGTQNFGLMQ